MREFTLLESPKSFN